MQMSIIFKAFKVVIHYLYIKIELFIYFLKLKIKESKKSIFSKQFKISGNISVAGNMLPEQEMFLAL